MRVLIVHSRYSSGPSSGENRVVEDDARLLAEAGHEVDIWQPETSAETAWDRARAGLRAVWSKYAVREVRARVVASRAEIVHVHNLFPQLSPVVIAAAADAGSAVVMTLHNFRLGCLAGTLLRDGEICEACVGRTPWEGVVHACYRGSRLGSASLALSLSIHRGLGTFGKVRTFAAASAFLRDKLVECGLDRDRISVRPNFVEDRPVRVGAGRYFVSLGRVAPEKGLDLLVRSWSGEYPLIVVGDGPDRPRLEAMAGPNVSFVGAVSRERAAEYLRDARALVFPSLSYEGSPRAVLEALATGVPVIASRRGSLTEHIDQNENGVLVDAGEGEAWLAAIDQLSDDRESARLGAGARRSWSRRFSPEEGLRSLEAVYAEAIT